MIGKSLGFGMAVPLGITQIVNSPLIGFMGTRLRYGPYLKTLVHEPFTVEDRSVNLVIWPTKSASVGTELRSPPGYPGAASRCWALYTCTCSRRKRRSSLRVFSRAW